MMQLTSPAFDNGDTIPERYTCDGDDINPPFTVADYPDEAVSFVLLIDDPDAPNQTWDHWVVWNIEPTDSIGEDSVPGEQGMNDFGKQAYGGPCPPSGTHRYFFKIYALDTTLDISQNSTKNDVEAAMTEHVIDQDELIGTYSR
jgi:Raf kinase inhibitor-like YbhB/YbcL family protein